MNVDLYYMVKDALFGAAACPDGPQYGFPCRSCMAEAVTNMLEDQYILSPKFSTHPLEEV